MALPTPDEIQYYQEHADDNQQGKLWAAAICCLVLAWVFIGLRFVARSRIEAKYQSDDWIIVAAGCTFTAFPIAMFILISVGFGKHIIFVTNPKLMVEVSKFRVASSMKAANQYRCWFFARSRMPSQSL